MKLLRLIIVSFVLLPGFALPCLFAANITFQNDGDFDFRFEDDALSFRLRKPTGKDQTEFVWHYDTNSGFRLGSVSPTGLLRLLLHPAYSSSMIDINARDWGTGFGDLAGGIGKFGKFEAFAFSPAYGKNSMLSAGGLFRSGGLFLGAIGYSKDLRTSDLEHTDSMGANAMVGYNGLFSFFGLTIDLAVFGNIGYSVRRGFLPNAGTDLKVAFDLGWLEARVRYSGGEADLLAKDAQNRWTVAGEFSVNDNGLETKANLNYKFGTTEYVSLKTEGAVTISSVRFGVFSASAVELKEEGKRTTTSSVGWNLEWGKIKLSGTYGEEKIKLTLYMDDLKLTFDGKWIMPTLTLTFDDFRVEIESSGVTKITFYCNL